MRQARHQFRESLKELEHDTLGGLDIAAQQLVRALESVSLQDVELAAMVITDDDRIDGRYLQPAPGAVEVRVMDAQSPVRDVTPVVALIQSLVRLQLEYEPSSVPSAGLPAENASCRLETGWTSRWSTRRHVV